MVLKLSCSDDYLDSHYAFDTDDDNEDLFIQERLDYQEEEEDLWSRKKRNTGRRPGGTNSTSRPNYCVSKWGQMLQNPELQVLGSSLRRVFRRQFRAPYPIYLRLVQWAKGWHVWNVCDCSGRERCPTEFKVLGYLRMVGQSACFDDVEELCYIKISTMHAFFSEFSKKGRNKLFPEHVRMPETVEEFAEIEVAYASIGIPGACGSMNVVHIALGSCPHGLINVCTGKEGYPTLAYTVICDH